jgi:hypothetical protein
MRIDRIMSLNLPLIDWEADMVAAIGEIVRNGVMFDIKNWGEETFNPESLLNQGRFDRISIYESDVTLLLMNYAVDVEALLKLLSKYLLESDLWKIRETVTEIQGRLWRFERSRRAEES